MQENQLLELQQTLIPQLVNLGLEVFGYQALDKAWADFHGDPDEVEFDQRDPINTLFIPWFLFNWSVGDQLESESSSQTIAEEFIQNHRESLTDQALDFLTSAIKRPFSFYEVKERLSGSELLIFDLIQEKEIQIKDKKIAKALAKDEIIFCALLLPISNQIYPLTVGPTVIPGLLRQEIIELKDEIRQRHNGDLINEDVLQAEASWLIARYLDLREDIESGDDDT
jgi:hypothetical protein